MFTNWVQYMIICTTYVLTFKRHLKNVKSNREDLFHNVLSTEFNYVPKSGHLYDFELETNVTNKTKWPKMACFGGEF